MKKILLSSKLGGLVGGIIGFILAFTFGYYCVNYIIRYISSRPSNDISVITEIVKQVKSNQILPQKIDEITTWTDVTAESSAIRYHYILSNVDTSELSSDYFKTYLSPSLCQNEETRKILDGGINMEYSYLTEDMIKNYFVLVTKDDCIK